MEKKTIIDGKKDKEYNRRIVIDGSENAKLCLDIKNIENLRKNPINIDECEIHELTFQKVQYIHANFSNIKINTVIFLDSKTTFIAEVGLFRDCGIKKLIFTPGKDDRICIFNDTFRDNYISTIDIDRGFSEIDFQNGSFQDNIIEKVKLKTTGEIYIRVNALKNNIIKSFIIEGIPKIISIREGALEENLIKELKLQATNTIKIGKDALMYNPIESIYLDAPNIEVEREFFNIRTLKVIHIPKDVYDKYCISFSKKYFESLKKYGLKIEFI